MEINTVTVTLPTAEPKPAIVHHRSLRSVLILSSHP